MKVKILVSIILTFIVFPAFVIGQRNLDLPKPGLTPDSPFYFIDVFSEKVNIFFTFSLEKKAEKAFRFAEEKLAEGKLMAERNKIKALAMANQKYQELLSIANQKTKEAKEKGRDVEELAVLITGRTLQHQEILMGAFERVPEEARPAIEKAINALRWETRRAVESVTGTKKDELLQRIEETSIQAERKIETLKEKTRVIKEELKDKGVKAGGRDVELKGETKKTDEKLRQEVEETRTKDEKARAEAERLKEEAEEAKRLTEEQKKQQKELRKEQEIQKLAEEERQEQQRQKDLEDLKEAQREIARQQELERQRQLEEQRKQEELRKQQECDNSDGWINSIRIPFPYCDGNKSCTDQGQEYRDYSYSGVSCNYSVTNTRVNKNCAECGSSKSCSNGSCINIPITKKCEWIFQDTLWDSFVSPSSNIRNCTLETEGLPGYHQDGSLEGFYDGSKKYLSTSIQLEFGQIIYRYLCRCK